MAEKKNGTKGTNPFTVDHDDNVVAEMPTLTRLLNRKKLGFSKETKTLKTVSGAIAPVPRVSGLAAPKPFASPFPKADGAEPEASNDQNQASQDGVTLSTEEDADAGIELQSPNTMVGVPSPQPPKLIAPSKTPSPANSTPSGACEISISLSSSNTESFELENSSGQPAEASVARHETVTLSKDVAATGLDESAEEEPTDPALAAPGENSGGVRVQTARPRPERDNKLALWNLKQLRVGPDPMGHGIATLIDKGAKAALFLAIVPPPEGSPVPHFVASASLSDHDRVRVWTGMRWDPTVVPELWNLFVRTGFVELSPPGTTTNIKSNRNVVRAAFGTAPNEWLLLVRAGPANGCRGVLAVIATKSLLIDLAAAMNLIAAPAPSAAKKPKAA